jgi:hypothetical protein
MNAKLLPTVKLCMGLIAAGSPLLTAAAAAQSTSQSDYDRGYQAGRADAARANQGADDNVPPPPDDNYNAPPRDDNYNAPPRDDNDNGPPPGDQNGYGQPEGGYDDVPPPSDYDATRPPPPPPGYQADARYAIDPQQDQRYEAYAEDWAARNCIKSSGNTAGGAVIGGLFGALLGSSIAGYHNRGTGALVGGLAGAAGGAAVGSAQDNATSPGCPPGYVVRRGAPAFYYDGYASGYSYAAPEWYHPWVFVEGRWSYRPYPYHSWYYGHYGYRRFHGGYGRRGWGYRHY